MEPVSRRWPRSPAVQWAIILTVLLASWELTGRSGVLNSAVFPSPSTIAQAATTAVTGPRFWRDATTTMLALLWGVGIGVVVGHAVGLLLGLGRRIRSVWEWPLAVLNSVPRFALAPLVIIAIGLGTTSRAFLAFLGVSIPVALLVSVGVRSVPSELRNATSVYGRRGVSRLVKLYLPASLPHMFAGLQLGVTQAIIAVVVAEMYNPRAGFGRWIALGQANLNPGQIWFASITVGLVGAATVVTIRAVGRRVAHWPA